MSVNGKPRLRIMTLANQKGGVGKTTTAINLCTALAAIGEKVLVIDIDSQGNASTGLGIKPQDRKPSTFELLIEEENLRNVIRETAVPRLHIVPASQDLLAAETELAPHADRPYRLKKAIEAYLREPPDSAAPDAPDALDFSYILIDCPPALNLLTLNALAVADSVIVPLQAEFFALEGLSQLMSTVEQVRETVNPNLKIQGIVMTMFDGRNNLARQVVKDVRSNLGELVYETVIPRNVRVSEAPSFGKPALIYDLQCPGSQAYLKLASELIRQEKQSG